MHSQYLNQDYITTEANGKEAQSINTLIEEFNKEFSTRNNNTCSTMNNTDSLQFKFKNMLME